MKKIFLLAVVLASILFTGCSPKKKLQKLVEDHPELFEKETKEVTVGAEIPIDTTIKIESTSAADDFTYKRLRSKTFKLETPDFTTFVTLSPQKGLIKSDKVEVKTTIKEKEIKIIDTVYVEKTVPVEFDKPKPIIITKPPKWAKWSIGFNILILIGIAIAILAWFKMLPKINFGQ